MLRSAGRRGRSGSSGSPEHRTRTRIRRVVLPLLLLLAIPRAASAGAVAAPCFYTRPLASPGAAGVTAGDFNGDGNPDVAAATRSAGAVSVYLGDGAGGFGPEVRYPAGANPFFVLTSDFNGDGKLDLAVANIGSAPPGIVQLMLGDGAGAFGPPVLVADATPIALDAGDLNGDGKTDLVIADNGTGSLIVLLGNGAGAFPGRTQYVIPSLNVFSVTIARVNGDSIPDLVTQTDFSHNVWVLLGTGGGAFGTPQAFAGGLIPYDTVVGDFNEDGKADVAVATGATWDVALLLGDGNGNLAAPLLFGTGPGARWIASADFNTDGHRDVVIAQEFTDSIRFYLGDGKGNLTGPAQFPVSPIPNQVFVADFNRDGKPDVATTSFSGLTVSINGLAVFPDAPIPAGVVGAPYPSVSFTAVAGIAPYTFSLSGPLPEGLGFAAPTATLSGTPTQAGTFPFTVMASSSNGCTGSRSYALVIEKGTTTLTLASSANPAVVGQPIVLTAVVSVVPPAAGTPSGTVTFAGAGGGQPRGLGTATLVGGVATLAIGTLPAGTTTIVAGYAGDANFLPATSPLLAQEVVVPEVPVLDARGLFLMVAALAVAGLLMARRAG